MSSQYLGFKSAVTGGGGSGFVTSSGMTANRVPYATAAQNIENGTLYFDPILNAYSIGAGGPPDGTAILDLVSTTKGFLAPGMTQVQRLAIVGPALGLIVFQKNGSDTLYVNTSTGWKALGDGNVTTILGFGAAGNIPMNTTATNLETSIIKQTAGEIQIAGNLSITTNTFTVGKISGAGTLPTIAAGVGAGAGATAAMAPNSTDMRGGFSFTTGALPTVNSIQATITFNVAYAAAPRTIILTPANEAAAQSISEIAGFGGIQQAYVKRTGITTLKFDVFSTNPAGGLTLAALTTYEYYYLVFQ